MKKIIIEELKKYKYLLIIQIILVAINCFLLAYIPKTIGLIIDDFFNFEENVDIIEKYIILLLIVSIFFIIIRLLYRVNTRYVTVKFHNNLIKRTYNLFLDTKMKEIQNIKNGELMSYFIKDTREIRENLYGFMSLGLRIFFSFFVAIYYMIKDVNITLTFFTLIPVFFSIIIIMRITKKLEQEFKKSQKSFTQMSEYIQESTDSIRTTKAYSCEERQIEEFKKKGKQVQKNNNNVDLCTNLLDFTITLCTGFCYTILITYGSKLVLDGKITVGELVACQGYIDLFLRPIFWIPRVISKNKRAKTSTQRLDKLLLLEKENNNFENQNGILEGNITIKDLTFSYSKHSKPVLKNINLNIEKGSTLGIIGKIGSGKTTLASLIIRLYDIPNQKILIDGQDINEINLKSLREQICYITQESFIFSDTIQENIQLFEPKDILEVEESTKKSIFYDDLTQMEKGIKTIVGERGVDLSGGQKQRVSISRAFLKKSKILILDDVFSALDYKTEANLLKNIKEETKDKTCIIISNRISNIRHSDNIIVIDEGRIVEQGTHKQLVNKKGEYYTFYKQQVKEKMYHNKSK